MKFKFFAFLFLSVAWLPFRGLNSENKGTERLGRHDSLRPCWEDQNKFCAEFKSKRKALIRSCLRDHFNYLNPACRIYLALGKQYVVVRDVCRKDRDTFCPPGKEHANQIANCIRKNMKSFSPDCQQALQELKQLKRLKRYLEEVPFISIWEGIQFPFIVGGTQRKRVKGQQILADP